ncbi:MAG: hypothetical protein VX733_07415 [Candidatus Latescibacterota bacterium]|nr:hypothetical protein [Candidatus Latescibacterota bacterium]
MKQRRHEKDRGSHRPAPGRSPEPMSAEEVQRSQARIDLCQRSLRSLSGVMIGAFVLIILLTTISHGDFVQVAARSLYFLILASVLTSLGAWIIRVLLEKKVGKEVKVSAEVLKK